MTSTRFIVLLAATSIASACATEPSPLEVYSLIRVNGRALPSTVLSVNVDDGTTYSVEAVHGALLLYENGRFSKERQFRALNNGIPSNDDLPKGTWSGSFVRTDSTLTISFVQVLTLNDGKTLQYVETFVYEILENGSTLRGIENVDGIFPGVYEYLRQ